ncbi:MAG: CotH kinase family protein [Cryomorphaceae bacterium]|nr:CotH kinase family protein [Cryomorphaceae bacterium]
MWRIHLLFFLLMLSKAGGQIYINEILAANQEGITDLDGDREDWIEIYNGSNIDIFLGGWHLSDRDNNLRMWKLPDTTTLKAGAYLLIWASGKDTIYGEEMHTNFRISREGEPILLTNADGNLIDRYPPVSLLPDQSYGRVPDGGNGMHVFYTPTPGVSNQINGFPPVQVDLNFSHEQGFYPNPFQLQILGGDADVEIYYTTDGTVPDTNANIYHNGIQIHNRKEDPNTISEIRSGVEHFWEPPKGAVPKIFALRVRPFRNGMPCGPEITGSFWTGHHDPQFVGAPIVSLIIDPIYLFDHHEGIYVPGIDFDTSKFENSYRRGPETERPAVFSYFDSTGAAAVHQNIGVRINGGITRRSGQKSLRLYARNQYGKNHFDYPFFSERNHQFYRRLLLNTPMGDWTKTVFKDELTTELTKPLGFEYLAFRPVLVFINGEYWALHFLKERRDRHYLSALSGVDEAQIQRLSNNMVVNDGNRHHFAKMLSVLDNTPKDDTLLLARIATYIDLENYIDYQIAQIYLANYDWPHHNIEYWRPDTAGGRWRWMFFDLDAAMRTYLDDNFSHYTRPFDPLNEDPDRHWASHILRSLLEIPEFERKFKDRFYQLMRTTFSAGNVLAEIDAMTDRIAPFMTAYTHRWQIPRSVYEWHENLTILRNFAVKRPSEMMRILQQSLGSPFRLYPNPGRELHLSFENVPQLPVEIACIDMLGRQFPLTYTQEDNRLTPNTRSLKPGQYIVRVTYQGQIFRHIWVKV